MAPTTARMRSRAASKAAAPLQRPSQRPSTRNRAAVLRKVGAQEAQRAASRSYQGWRACRFSRRCAVQKVDSGGLRQCNLGACAKRPFPFKYSRWKSSVCRREGRAGQTRLLSKRWGARGKVGARRMIRPPGSKSAVYFSSVDWERHLTCSAAASGQDQLLRGR